MATYINPSAIKDGTISASKTDETIATKEELTELSLKVGEFKVKDASVSGNTLNITKDDGTILPFTPQDCGGGNSHWVLRETHTFDGVNGTITISDLPMEFLALLDYNGVIDKPIKMTFQVGEPEKMRSAYDFEASRQMHIGFYLTFDGVITNVISHYSEWNNNEPTTPKIVYSPTILPQALKLLVYSNYIIPEGTTIKIYTR